MPEDYNAKIINYIQKTRRAIVEISARQGKRTNTQRILKIEDNPKDDGKGRIKGFIESL